LRRLVEEPVWQQVKALGLKGVREQREYKRRYPEGESAAHVVGFTNIDDKGQEGIELGFQNQLIGQPGQRTVVRDRLGRVVENVGDEAGPVDGRDVVLSIDSKVQFFAWQRVRDAVQQARGPCRQRGGAGRVDGRGAGAGQLPELRPGAAATT
jgi:cell division protein FtsI (penicillin-binding protein 3)